MKRESSESLVHVIRGIHTTLVALLEGEHPILVYILVVKDYSSLVQGFNELAFIEGPCGRRGRHVAMDLDQGITLLILSRGRETESQQASGSQHRYSQ